jgi:hypothetical protein
MVPAQRDGFSLPVVSIFILSLLGSKSVTVSELVSLEKMNTSEPAPPEIILSPGPAAIVSEPDPPLIVPSGP